MAYDILKGSSGTALVFLMVESADHITGLTGASPTVTLSKNGGAFASPSGAVTEIANGWYKVAGNATDSNTAGPLALHATAASGDPTDIVVGNVIDATVAVYGGNLVNIAGSAVSTTSAQLGVNAVQINAVSTSSVTTINANQGTTQPVNFTGTGASALVKSDVTDIAGSAVSTSTAQIGVNLVNIAGSAVSTSSAQLGVNVVNIGGHAATLDANNLLEVGVQDWNGAAVNSLVGGKVDAVNSVRTGTAQAGGATSITLDSGASATNNFYNGLYAQIISGTGAGQVRLIMSYTGSTKVANVDHAWATNPDVTSVFALFPQGDVDVRAWGGNGVTVNVAGIPEVDVLYWNGTAVHTPGTAGIPDVNLINIANSAVSTSTAQLGVNTVNIAGQAAALDANNLLKVDVEDVNGSATIETGITIKQSLQYMSSALVGVLAGAATTSVTIAAINNSGTNRITATVDANGDRSAVTLS